MEGYTIITSLKLNGEPKSPKGVKTMVVNVDVMSVSTFPLASSYGRKVKPQISILTSSPRPRKKCYGQM